MITLGIETSCDETALCLLETREAGGVVETREKSDGVLEYKILANLVHSQIDLHRPYGGVFPALAKREHIKNLPVLFRQLKENLPADKKIDLIAVTTGPGLAPALWTGIDFARELHTSLGVPIVPVNHMEGHIVSTLLETSDPASTFTSLKHIALPALAVLISGGHTEIVAVEKIGSYKILGRTKDDAVGEAFDKVARMLELPYPGGPEISKLAEEARVENLPQTITLPRPMIHSKDSNFSFSGLKTSVLYLLKEKGELNGALKKEICREFEDAITEVLINKTSTALDENEYKTLIVGGGVIANKHVREAFTELALKYDIPLYLPASGLTGDNALMIALAGVLRYTLSLKDTDPISLKAEGNLSLDSKDH